VPKQSKIKSTRPPKAAPLKEEPSFYYCTRCGKHFARQKGNFSAIQSPLYAENNGFIPVCRECVNEIYEHYRTALNDDKEAIHRICMKFDVYWCDRCYELAVNARLTNTNSTLPLLYLQKSNLIQFANKTYDDTLDEALQPEQPIISALPSSDDDDDTVESPVSVDVINFWGTGYTPDFYAELEHRYHEWTDDKEITDQAEKALYKQICILECTINRDVRIGKAIDKNVSALNTLLGSMNLKPAQKKAEEAELASDATPFGVWIKRWEDQQPVADPDPELRDVDGLIRYIDVWFRGHLAKMLGIKNSYSKLYNDEIERLRVDHPEYEEEDDEDLFNDIFESDGDQAGDDI